MPAYAKDIRTFLSSVCRKRAIPVSFLLLAIVTAGCAAIQNEKAVKAERLLAAAGFQMKLADTPEKLAALEAKPQRVIVPVQGKDGKPFFMYADATTCKCLYIGTEDAYQRYQRLVVQQQIAEDQQIAAQMNQNAAMDWGMWGPWGPWW